MKKNKRHTAIVLLSGGLDSATLLYWVKRTHDPLALVIRYGQRHSKEVAAALRIARKAGVKALARTVPFPAFGSALLDARQAVPRKSGRRIPATYVPARNTVFLSLAASYAEALGIHDIYIGVNAVDYSGYPDCRPEYIRSFNRLLKRATRTGVEGEPLRIKTPLINLTKAQIIKRGTRLGVPYELTWSCYQGGRKPCGVCDSCRLRARGFREAGIYDPFIG